MNSPYYLSPEFALQTLTTMESNNAWFLSELVDLERKALDAALELEKHRQSMNDRHIIIQKLKEMIQ